MLCPGIVVPVFSDRQSAWWDISWCLKHRNDQIRVAEYHCKNQSEFFLQYIPRNMHMVFALLCFVVVIHWLNFHYPSGLLHWHCGNLTIAPVPAKQPWWIWIDTSCEFIMNDCITTTKQSTTKPCAYFLGYTVYHPSFKMQSLWNFECEVTAVFSWLLQKFVEIFWTSMELQQ